MANMKRSGKFYRNNEAEVMKLLGLNPTKNSGSGWIEKEDGQSENVICQLKSTDAGSIKVNKQDIEILEYNAQVAHKLPVFAINYLTDNSVYLIVKPELLIELATYIKTGEMPSTRYEFLGIDEVEEVEEDEYENGEQLDNVPRGTNRPRRMIGSSSEAREKFLEENKKKFQKKIKKDR